MKLSEIAYVYKEFYIISIHRKLYTRTQILMCAIFVFICIFVYIYFNGCEHNATQMF